jgi:hypothetical protein
MDGTITSGEVQVGDIKGSDPELKKAEVHGT